MRSHRQDRAQGTVEKVAGRAMEAWSKLTGRHGTGAKGKGARVRGTGRRAQGRVKRGAR